MKTLDRKVILAVVGLSALLAVLNNFRVAPEKRVTWFGGQIVLPEPEDIGR
ncbi:MAG TPA: hypothetical protein PK208_11160 [Fibrobacteria bacterium]|nr:hypothetical protein [Fibrobacteria bacterium]